MPPKICVTAYFSAATMNPMAATTPATAVPTSPAPKPRRRWRQFSLRTLMVGMVVFSLLFAALGIRAERARRQAAAVATIRKFDHIVQYQESSVPLWLTSWLGRDFFDDVKEVWCREGVQPQSPKDINQFAEAISDLSNVESFRGEAPWIDRRTTAWLGRQSTLRFLNLEKSNLGDSDVEPLQRLHQLEQLLITEGTIGDEAAKHLANFPNLKNLCLRRTQIGDDGMALIAAGSPSLRMLQLGETQVGDRGAAEIAKIQTLRDVKLDGTNVTDAGLVHLGRLQNLNWLQLSDTAITDRGVLYLASLSKLETLEISGTDVTGTPFEQFALDSQVENLVMNDCPVSDAGIRAVARLSNLKNLHLNNLRTPLASLDQIVWPTSLEEVHFSGSALSDEGLARLAKCPNLKTVYVHRTQVTAEGIKQFKVSRPTAKVYGP
ncbi:MAG TPA: hypothetical protein VMP01_28435 [Pirellulaceae bacterium]|nr:hypothetical protein [Pirellulaceae bacterium]